jgi:hypothetical protein
MKKQKLETPRILTLVRHVSPPGERITATPFRKAKTYVFLGELKNMPGHCVVADVKTGRIHSCWHSDRFVELSSDEV